MSEISNQLEKEEMPTHIFLQGGVGSFPAAISSSEGAWKAESPTARRMRGSGSW